MTFQKHTKLGAILLAAVMAVPASVAAQAPVRVSGAIKDPSRTKYVAPVYPEVALRARIQGAVILEITIGTDGRVTNAKVLRPLALLDAAAVEAVRQWEYAPTLLNGSPVEVLMIVTVDFSVSPGSRSSARPQPPAPLAPFGSQVIVVPPGYVVVDVTIGKDGSVRDVKLIKGDETLAAPALEALRQWRHTPALLNGVPIEVQITVLVPIKVPSASSPSGGGKPL